MRSFNGCWTCRLRRKKCDENHPVCEACAALHISCYYDLEKPEWMDGGARQERMAKQLKREIREKARHRRGERGVHGSGDIVSGTETPASKTRALAQEPPVYLATPVSHLVTATPDSPYTSHNDMIQQSANASTLGLWREVDGNVDSMEGRDGEASGWPDACLFMFYIEHLLPFLFPFYRPSLLQGGRSWILDMMMSSPVVRQTALCQASYFFSLALGIADCDVAWENVLMQTKIAFEMLRQSLQKIDARGIGEHMREAVRTIASIMQVQRFDITVSSFENCQAHLNAAVALVKQILDSNGGLDVGGGGSSFDAVMSHLGPSSWRLPSQCFQVPSAEQVAFGFSTALVIFDDIIASTALQEQPKLYDYHRCLLIGNHGTKPPINLETIVGCQNWAMVQIGEIATLDAWKQRCKRAGSLNVIELVNRATAIKDSLTAQITRLEADLGSISGERKSVLNLFPPYYSQPTREIGRQGSVITRIWAHAALVYLCVVVSGWQPANTDVRYHVGQICELLSQHLSSPALLRSVVWPFCVAGCLAEPVHEASLRGMVEELQPPAVFGTVHKALEIMEYVWRNRESGDVSTRDLATYLRSQNGIHLLV
jgi:hypothetical protein